MWKSSVVIMERVEEECPAETCVGVCLGYGVEYDFTDLVFPPNIDTPE